HRASLFWTARRARTPSVAPIADRARGPFCYHPSDPRRPSPDATASLATAERLGRTYAETLAQTDRPLRRGGGGRVRTGLPSLVAGRPGHHAAVPVQRQGERRPDPGLVQARLRVRRDAHVGRSRPEGLVG